MVRPEGFGKLKTFSDLMGNRTRDLPACSTVHQPKLGRNRFIPRLWFEPVVQTLDALRYYAPETARPIRSLGTLSAIPFFLKTFV
jgi:hypothetical protein